MMSDQHAAEAARQARAAADEAHKHREHAATSAGLIAHALNTCQRAQNDALGHATRAALHQADAEDARLEAERWAKQAEIWVDTARDTQDKLNRRLILFIRLLIFVALLVVAVLGVIVIITWHRSVGA